MRLLSSPPVTGLQEASWTMSTPGILSGIFNDTLLEDDDDLRVPSLASIAADLQNELSNTNTSTQTVMNSTDTKGVPQLKLSKRTFSADIRLYVDEEALAKVLTPSLAVTSSITGFDFPLTMSTANTNTVTSTSLSSPAILLDDSLACEWMNRSFRPDEFEKVLRNPDVTLTGFSLESDQESDSEDVEVTLPIMQVPFESLLELEEFTSSPSPSPTPVALPTLITKATKSTPTASKKRGRSNKEDVQEKPAPKKAKSVAAVKTAPTSKPHPLARPTTDDPEEMERYIKYRQTNNEAACKSRLRRKERETQSANRVVELEAQNTSLKKELSSLQTEVARLKDLLEAHLRKQN